MKIGEIFDDLQQEYTAKMLRWVPYYDKLIQQFLTSLPEDFSPQVIIDLGSGNGNVIATIISKFPDASYVLVDASEQMLQEAHERFRDHNIHSHHAMIQDTAFPAESCDIVTASFSLHHLKAMEKSEAIKSAYQWLRPSGYFCYADLFVDKLSNEHQGFLNQWEKYVRKSNIEGDWEYLFDHYQTYDFPTGISTQLEWFRKLDFSQIKLSIYEKYWIYLCAKK